MKSEHFPAMDCNAEQMMEVIRIITEKVRGSSAREVLQQLVEAIADVLSADAVFVGRIEAASDFMKTIAQVVDGNKSESFQYPLSGTPCEKVMKSGVCSFGEDVAERFPEDKLLVEMKVKAYVGIPLRDGRGQVRGAIVALYHAMPENFSSIKAIIALFATRASVELEREELEQKISESEESYRQFFEEDLTGDYVTTPDGRLLDANPAFLSMFGFTSLKQAQETDMSTLYARKEDRERVLRLLEKKRKLKNLEGRASKIDGTPMVFLENAVGHFDAEGNLIRIRGYLLDITREKEAETRLRDSEEKFRVLAEASPVAIMIYQGERFVYANPAASTITGFSTDELCRMEWWSIVHPDHRDMVKERGISRLAKEEIQKHYEFKITRKDGVERWVDFTGNLIEFEGRPSGLVVAIDITDRKEIELRLRKDEARLKVLFDQSPVSLWEEDFSEVKARMNILRDEGIEDMRGHLHAHPEVLQELVNSVKVTDVNQASLNMFHASNKKQLSQNFGKVLHTEASQTWTEHLCALYEGALNFSREGIARTLDRKRIYVHWRFSVPEAYRETWEKVLVSIIDITERYRMETQLKESEAKFRALFEQSPVALKLEDFSGVKAEIEQLRTAGEGELRNRLTGDTALLSALAAKVRTISINSSARILLGIQGDEDGSLSLTQSFTDASLENFGKQLIALLDGEPYAGEGEAKTVDGTVKHVYVQLNLIEETKGTWDRVLVSIIDLTEQKKLEGQLRQSQKLETVGTLAGGIAHDFNNILTPILGYTELLRMNVVEGSFEADYLDRIETASLRAKDLVKQMLAFSRHSEEEKAPIHLAPLVTEVVQLLRASIPATVEIQTQLDEDCGRVLVDKTQIHQVVLNLCTNAAQAMPFGGTLTISLNQLEITGQGDAEPAGLKPGLYLKLAVRDTGTGMDNETLERIFDPFFTTKEVGKGTGLGLSMVHGVAAGHGGCCTVESELGEGSTFCVYLPVIDEDALPVSETKEQISEISTKGNGRVLIVDDDPDVLDLHREVLTGIGYEAAAFSNSEAALEAVRENPFDFDAIVTDLTMPGITGLQLAVGVYEIRRDLPVVLVTGYREELTPEIRSRTGIRKVLMKPVKIQALSDAVREVLLADRPGRDEQNVEC